MFNPYDAWWDKDQDEPLFYTNSLHPLDFSCQCKTVRPHAHNYHAGPRVFGYDWSSMDIDNYAYRSRYPDGIGKSKTAQDLICPNCGDERIGILEEADRSDDAGRSGTMLALQV